MLISFIAATSRWVPNQPFCSVPYFVTVRGEPSCALPSQRGGLFSGGFGSGLMGGLLGGLVGAGLFGLLSGNGLFGGLGGLSSIFGLLLQIGLLFRTVNISGCVAA